MCGFSINDFPFIRGFAVICLTLVRPTDDPVPKRICGNFDPVFDPDHLELDRLDSR